MGGSSGKSASLDVDVELPVEGGERQVRDGGEGAPSSSREDQGHGRREGSDGARAARGPM
eukprot:3253125-Pyramimonas_sp.AAC.1